MKRRDFINELRMARKQQKTAKIKWGVKIGLKGHVLCQGRPQLLIYV